MEKEMKRYARMYRRSAENVIDNDGCCCHSIERVQGHDSMQYSKGRVAFHKLHCDDVTKKIGEHRFSGYWFRDFSEKSQNERALLLLLTAEAAESGDL